MHETRCPSPVHVSPPAFSLFTPHARPRLLSVPHPRTFRPEPVVPDFHAPAIAALLRSSGSALH
eukprot:7506589-Prorocentrum_lima.AAC.1